MVGENDGFIVALYTIVKQVPTWLIIRGNKACSRRFSRRKREAADVKGAIVMVAWWREMMIR